MPSNHDPADCLADILENVARIEQYMASVQRAAFAEDGRTRDAVERCLEHICEAAVRLGDIAADLMPDQPWNDIRGMGNWFRHAYDRISLEIVWDTVQYRLPSLKADAERALSTLHAQHPRHE